MYSGDLTVQDFVQYSLPHGSFSHERDKEQHDKHCDTVLKQASCKGVFDENMGVVVY